MTAEAELESKLLSELRVTELKQELEKRNLDKNGIKIMLVERLEKALRTEGHDPQTFKFYIGPGCTSTPISSQTPVADHSVSSTSHATVETEEPADNLDTTGDEGSLRVVDTSGTELCLDDDVAIDEEKCASDEPAEGRESCSSENKDSKSLCPDEELDHHEEELEDPLNEVDEKSECDAASPVLARTMEPTDSPDAKDKEDEQELLKRSVWVRGLSIAVKAAELKNLFAEHGKVLRAKIFTTKKQAGLDQQCYGYVTLVDMESFEKCFTQLHKLVWRNMTLNIEKAIKFRLPPVSSPSNSDKASLIEPEAGNIESTSDSPKDAKKSESNKKDPSGKKSDPKESKHERITIDKPKKANDNRIRRDNDKDVKSRKDDRRPAKDIRRPARRPIPSRRSEGFRGSSSYRPSLSNRVTRPYGRTSSSANARHGPPMPRSGNVVRPDPMDRRDVMEIRMRDDARRVRDLERNIELQKQQMQIEREKIEKEKLELQLKLALVMAGNTGAVRSEGFATSDTTRNRTSSHSRHSERDRDRDRDRERDRERDRVRDREQREKHVGRVGSRAPSDGRRHDRSSSNIHSNRSVHPDRDRSVGRNDAGFSSKHNSAVSGNYSRGYERENFNNTSRETAGSSSLGNSSSYYGGRDSYSSGTASRDNNYSSSRTMGSSGNWNPNAHHSYGNQNWSSSGGSGGSSALNTNWTGGSGGGGGSSSGGRGAENSWAYGSNSSMRYDYDNKYAARRY